MPNGRTSLFYVTREDFPRLLDGFPDDAEISWDFEPMEFRGVKVSKGVTEFRFDKREIRIVTAADVRRRLDEHEDDKVVIDEQDHTWYIVCFSKPGAKRSSQQQLSTLRMPQPRGFLRRLLGRRALPDKVCTLPPWVTVSETSPLHSRLRQYHQKWLKERHVGEVVFLSSRFLEYDGREWRETEP